MNTMLNPEKLKKGTKVKIIKKEMHTDAAPVETLESRIDRTIKARTNQLRAKQLKAPLLDEAANPENIILNLKKKYGLPLSEKDLRVQQLLQEKAQEPRLYDLDAFISKNVGIMSHIVRPEKPSIYFDDKIVSKFASPASDFSEYQITKGINFEDYRIFSSKNPSPKATSNTTMIEVLDNKNIDTPATSLRGSPKISNVYNGKKFQEVSYDLLEIGIEKPAERPKEHVTTTLELIQKIPPLSCQTSILDTKSNPPDYIDKPIILEESTIHAQPIYMHNNEHPIKGPFDKSGFLYKTLVKEQSTDEKADEQAKDVLFDDYLKNITTTPFNAKLVAESCKDPKSLNNIIGKRSAIDSFLSECGEVTYEKIFSAVDSSNCDNHEKETNCITPNRIYPKTEQSPGLTANKEINDKDKNTDMIQNKKEAKTIKAGPRNAKEEAYSERVRYIFYPSICEIAEAENAQTSSKQRQINQTPPTSTHNTKKLGHSENERSNAIRLTSNEDNTTHHPISKAKEVKKERVRSVSKQKERNRSSSRLFEDHLSTCSSSTSSEGDHRFRSRSTPRRDFSNRSFKSSSVSPYKKNSRYEKQRLRNLSPLSLNSRSASVDDSCDRIRMPRSVSSSGPDNRVFMEVLSDDVSKGHKNCKPINVSALLTNLSSFKKAFLKSGPPEVKNDSNVVKKGTSNSTSKNGVKSTGDTIKKPIHSSPKVVHNSLPSSPSKMKNPTTQVPQQSMLENFERMGNSFHQPIANGNVVKSSVNKPIPSNKEASPSSSNKKKPPNSPVRVPAFARPSSPQKSNSVKTTAFTRGKPKHIPVKDKTKASSSTIDIFKKSQHNNTIKSPPKKDAQLNGRNKNNKVKDCIPKFSSFEGDLTNDEGGGLKLSPSFVDRYYTTSIENVAESLDFGTSQDPSFTNHTATSPYQKVKNQNTSNPINQQQSSINSVVPGSSPLPNDQFTFPASNLHYHQQAINPTQTHNYNQTFANTLVQPQIPQPSSDKNNTAIYIPSSPSQHHLSTSHIYQNDFHMQNPNQLAFTNNVPPTTRQLPQNDGVVSSSISSFGKNSSSSSAQSTSKNTPNSSQLYNNANQYSSPPQPFTQVSNPPMQQSGVYPMGNGRLPNAADSLRRIVPSNNTPSPLRILSPHPSFPSESAGIATTINQMYRPQFNDVYQGPVQQQQDGEIDNRAPSFSKSEAPSSYTKSENPTSSYTKDETYANSGQASSPLGQGGSVPNYNSTQRTVYQPFGFEQTNRSTNSVTGSKNFSNRIKLDEPFHPIQHPVLHQRSENIPNLDIISGHADVANTQRGSNLMNCTPNFNYDRSKNGSSGSKNSSIRTSDEKTQVFLQQKPDSTTYIKLDHPMTYAAPTSETRSRNSSFGSKGSANKPHPDPLMAVHQKQQPPAFNDDRSTNGSAGSKNYNIKIPDEKKQACVQQKSNSSTYIKPDHSTTYNAPTPDSSVEARSRNTSFGSKSSISKPQPDPLMAVYQIQQPTLQQRSENFGIMDATPVHSDIVNSQGGSNSNPDFNNVRSRNGSAGSKNYDTRIPDERTQAFVQQESNSPTYIKRDHPTTYNAPTTKYQAYNSDTDALSGSKSSNQTHMNKPQPDPLIAIRNNLIMSTSPINKRTSLLNNDKNGFSELGGNFSKGFLESRLDDLELELDMVDKKIARAQTRDRS